jgi:hypothetical protein
VHALKSYNRTRRKTMNGASRTPWAASSALDLLKTLRTRDRCQGNDTSIII